MISAPVRAVAAYRFANYRRTWKGTMVGTIVNPIMFLLAIGVGLGSLVEEGTTDTLEGVAYLAFVAPGMLAATAMFTGVNDSTYPVLGSVKWHPTTFAQVATPITPAQAALGHLLWNAIRLLMSVGAFFVVMAIAGAPESWWVLAAVPAAILTGLAFAAPVQAWAVGLESDALFPNVQRFVVLPMFLFSGTFFPTEQLPDAVEPLTVLTPLWHGVELCRSLSLGTATLGGSLVHVVVLGAVTAAGIVASSRTYERRLTA
ncbi:MAG: ABC transporter permease [Actinomycetota bacterium]